MAVEAMASSEGANQSPTRKERLLRPEERLPQPLVDTNVYDIAIIGAGAVGCAIARELSRYRINVVLLESNSDVGMGTSKASTAIWHTGYDATPGSVESGLLKRSYPLMQAFMQEVGSPFELVGGLLIAWNEEQLQALPRLLRKAHQNGETDVCLINAEEVYRREPYLGSGALGGMFVPGEGILCTFTIPLACATQAVVNGVALKLDFRVQSIVKENGVHVLASATEIVRAHWIINAAGLFADDVNAHFGHTDFKVTPRRGELIVYDKLARALVNHVLLPVPTETTKGVLISPTVYGNVLLGPTAEDVADKTATETSERGLRSLIEKGKRMLPALVEEEVTATYAGLRSATQHSDYQITLHADQRYICVGGIRSTGISGCLGIAAYVTDLLKEGGLWLEPKPNFKTITMPTIGEAFRRPYQNDALIRENADYGRMLCHCERVSLGEVNAAVRSVIPATTLDGLRRRTRAIQGRCQGFTCHASLLMSLRSRLPPTRQSPAGAEDTSLAPRRLRSALPGAINVLIVGGGPAGLAAALELKKRGVHDVIVTEREAEAGGIPRMCGHPGFGVGDLHRVMTGPHYAQRYREMAEKSGVRVQTSTTITGWAGPHRLSYTSPTGVGTIEARSILLATGVRERPRSARLIPGHRTQGVYTTGSLQRFIYEHHLPVGKRAVIVGAERVSLSVLLTLRHAGVKVLKMVTELPSHQLYPPLFLPAKILFADILGYVPILTNHRISNILGRPRLQAVEITDVESGRTHTLECDTVVFTGDWIPENELARRGGVDTSQPALGPQVDAWYRTSQPGVFAAGNLLRGVETADWTAHEGRAAARAIARYLQTDSWNGARLALQPESPLAWVYPNVLSPDVPVDRFWFRSKEFRDKVRVQLRQGGRVLYQRDLYRLVANTSLGLDAGWLGQVDFMGEPVKLVIQG